MLPLIGIMIGFYIINRCLSFVARTGDRSESGLVKVFSIITIVVAAVVILSLIGSSFSPTALPR
jgi:hypothetical protein